MEIERLLTAGPLAVGIGIAASVIGRIIIVWIALRGSCPADRPAIIEAVAELFRFRSRRQ